MYVLSSDSIVKRRHEGASDRCLESWQPYIKPGTDSNSDILNIMLDILTIQDYSPVESLGSCLKHTAKSISINSDHVINKRSTLRSWTNIDRGRQGPLQPRLLPNTVQKHEKRAQFAGSNLENNVLLFFNTIIKIELTSLRAALRPFKSIMCSDGELLYCITAVSSELIAHKTHKYGWTVGAAAMFACLPLRRRVRKLK